MIAPSLPYQIRIASFLLLFCPVMLMIPELYFFFLLRLLPPDYDLAELILIASLAGLPVVLSLLLLKSKKWPRAVVLIIAGLLTIVALMRFGSWNYWDVFPLLYIILLIISAILLYGKRATAWYAGQKQNETDSIIDQV